MVWRGIFPAESVQVSFPLIHEEILTPLKSANFFCANLREILNPREKSYRHTHTGYRSTRFALRKTT